MNQNLEEIRMWTLVTTSKMLGTNPGEKMQNAKISMERRGHPRLVIKMPVKYRVEDDTNVLKRIDEWQRSEKRGHAQDLSLSGMHLVVDQRIAVGSILKFDITLPEMARAISIFAEVVWANKEGAGIRFLMIKPADMDSLRAFLDKASSA